MSLPIDSVARYSCVHPSKIKRWKIDPPASGRCARQRVRRVNVTRLIRTFTFTVAVTAFPQILSRVNAMFYKRSLARSTHAATLAVRPTDEGSLIHLSQTVSIRCCAFVRERWNTRTWEFCQRTINRIDGCSIPIVTSQSCHERSLRQIYTGHRWQPREIRKIWKKREDAFKSVVFERRTLFHHFDDNFNKLGAVYRIRIYQE